MQNFKQWWSEHWKRVCTWTGIVLLGMVSLALIFNQPIANWILENQSGQVVKPNNQANYNYGQVKSLSSTDVLKARMKHHNYIGALAMPAQNMSTPIVEGVANSDLAVGAGTLRPHMKMGKGNYALAGHNMDTTAPVLFSPLYQAFAKGPNTMNGQKIYVSDLKRVYVYKVDQSAEISPKAVNVINNTSRPILTLITCNYSGSQRIMVRASYQKSYPFGHASAKVRSMLTQNVQSNK